MNRRERRNMQKQLGLNKHYKKETKETKWARWRDNQDNGNRMMQEKAEEVRISLQKQEDEKESAIILHEAENIAKEKSIPLIDAMVEAQQKYQKTKA